MASVNGNRARRFFFPDQPRSFAGRRALKIVLRALHVLCVGVFVGAHVLAAEQAACEMWLWWTILSGCALLLLDLHESGTFLLQVRGLVIVAKLIVVGFVASSEGRHPWVLGALLVVSVISSHAPSSVRYYMVFGARDLTGSQSRG